MAIALRSVGVSPGADSTTCVIVKPAGLTVGDLMIAHVVSSYAGTPSSISSPGSWTEIRQDAGERARGALFWKIAVQADVDATDFTFTTGSGSNIGVISAWTGHDTTTPINANNGQWNDTSATVTSPAITPSVADCEILMFCGIEWEVTHSGYAIATDNPASWTEAYDIGTPAGTDSAVAMGYATRPETTSTGLGTATASIGARNVGQLVAIAPATLGVTISSPLVNIAIAIPTPTITILPLKFPPLKVRIAFDTAPFVTTPTWTDISSDVIAFTTRKGRQRELARIEAGTAQILLNNSSGNYWPDNTGGDYSPNVLPGKRINIRAVYGGSIYDLFTGFIEAFEPSWLADAGLVPVMRLRCSDLIRNLSRLEINSGGESEEVSDVRIGNILDEMGWPAGDRDLDTGRVTMQATGTLTNENAWGHLQTIQESEMGIIFIAGDGDVQFQNRIARRESPFDSSSATFGDDAGEQKYRGIDFSLDDSLIYNDIRITAEGGAEQTATDSTSQTDYGKRSISKSGLLMVSDGDALLIADHMLRLYKDPLLRTKSITILPQADAANLFPKVLAYDISTRITVRLNQASADKEYHIEGIEHNYDGRTGVWETKWELGDATATIPDIQTLRPDADGNYTAWTAKSAGSHYVEVDEATADDNTTWISKDGADNFRDSFTFPNGNGKGTIEHITVYARIKFAPETGSAKVFVRISSTDYDQSISLVSADNWTTESYQWTVNPATSAAWTWTEINALEVGIQHSLGSGGQTFYCTQIYVEVRYLY